MIQRSVILSLTAAFGLLALAFASASETKTGKLLIENPTIRGTIKTANLAWTLGDIGVGVMAWLNIVGILILFFMGKPAVKALRDYEEQRKAGVSEYSFDPDKLGIKNADFWKNN